MNSEQLGMLENDIDFPLFTISVSDMQNEAIEKLGRQLTSEELDIASKGLVYGLLTMIDVVYNTILFKMIAE